MSTSMQMMDFMNNRRANNVRQQENQTRPDRSRENARSNGSDFKSFLENINTNQAEKKITERKKMEADSKAEKIEKLATEIKEKLKESEEVDGDLIEEILALLAEFDLLLEEVLVEELTTEENLAKLGELLENLDLNELAAELENSDDKAEFVAQLLDDEQILEKLVELEAKAGEFKQLLTDEQHDMLKLQQLLQELKEVAEDSDLDLSNADDLKDQLKEVTKLLEQLEGKLAKVEPDLETDFRKNLELMSQKQLLNQRKKLQKNEKSSSDEKPILFDETGDMKLLEELSAQEIKELLAQENEASQEKEQNLFEFDFSNSEINLLATEELVTEASRSEGVDFNQFLLSETVMEQIGEELELLNLSKGKDEISLQLEPKSLGKININLNLEDGEMIAKIVTETVEVRDLLQNNFTLLRDMLAQKDMNIENFDFSFLTQDEELADNSGGRSESERNFFNQGEQREPNIEFDLEKLTKIDVQHSDPMLTSKDVDYVI